MKCDDIKKLLNPYIDNELSEEDANRVKMHLQECVDCAKEVAELDKVRQMINDLPRLKAPCELVETVRQRMVKTEPASVSILWRYRWVISSFASAAAVLILVYVAIINSYQYKSHSGRESILKEQKRPEGLFIESKSLTKDKPIKSSGSSVVTLSQNIRITTDDINRTKDKIYGVVNVATGSFFGGFSDEKNKEGGVTEDRSVEGRAELKSGNNYQGKGGGVYKKGAEQSVQKGHQQYVVKVTIPLSKKDAFIQNLKSNISDQMTFSQIRVASTGKFMTGEVDTEELTRTDGDLDDELTADAGVDVEKNSHTIGKELLESDVVQKQSKLLKGDGSAARPEDKKDTIQPASQPQTPTSLTPPEADMTQGSSKKAASEKTGATPPPQTASPQTPPSQAASPKTPPPPTSGGFGGKRNGAIAVPPSASSTPSSNEIAKKDAKDKTSDNASLRKQEDLLKREADTPIGGGARG
ncbi:MAG: anti-sigma factor, partial [Planctomycetota bacterium]